MKKLMIAAAIVCAAAMSQAATYNWTAAATGIFVDAGQSYTGLKDGSDWFAKKGLAVYIFDANAYDVSNFSDKMTADAIATALGNALGTTAAVATKDYGVISAGGKGDFDGVTNPGAVGLSAVGGKGSAYAVIFNTADAADATEYFVTNVKGNIDCTGTVASMGSNAQIKFGDIDATGGWYQVAAVPEPTSGLLLLLGVAGLALRRRRA